MPFEAQDDPVLLVQLNVSVTSASFSQCTLR